jgi:hypothetical protein
MLYNKLALALILCITMVLHMIEKDVKMMRLELPDEINYLLKCEKAQLKISTLQDMIIHILAQRYNLVRFKKHG